MKKKTVKLPNWLEVVVRTKRKVLFVGKAWAVSGVNELGPFDILPRHARFVGEIKERVVVHLEEGEKREWRREIGEGIIWVDGKGRVEVFC